MLEALVPKVEDFFSCDEVTSASGFRNTEAKAGAFKNCIALDFECWMIAPMACNIGDSLDLEVAGATSLMCLDPPLLGLREHPVATT